MRIQYLGEPGISVLCLLAIEAILNSGYLPESVTIVTHMHDRRNQQGEHLFLFWDWGHFPLTIVPSGFASGYPGEGPKSFSLAICRIASKEIPIKEVEVGGEAFEAIDRNRAPQSIFSKLKAEEKSTTLEDLVGIYVYPEHMALLESGRLWRAVHYHGPAPDSITEAIAKIDDYHNESGEMLRMAVAKLGTHNPKEWQQVGILVRDAWIELTRKLCDTCSIDTSDVPGDNVKMKLNKLDFDERILKLAASAFDLSQKIQHDRKASKEVASACVLSTIMSMQMLIPRSKYLKLL